MAAKKVKKKKNSFHFFTVIVVIDEYDFEKSKSKRRSLR